MFKIEEILLALKKLISRKDVLFIFLLIIGYFATRLVRLDRFPIFSDEGIYIHWAKVAWHDASWRFISLTDGKQPLQTWGTIPFLKLFPNNALLAGRLFSVATGLAGLVGIFTLLFYLFGKKSAFLGSFLYILCPYFLFYDRMALVDSGVNAGSIWIFFFSILLAKTQRLDAALLFGLVTGMSLLAKSSVRVFLALSALSPVLFVEKNIKLFFRKTINYYFLFVIVTILSFAIYNVQRLSPFFHFVSEKNKTFVMTFGEFVKSPFSVFFHNIQIIPVYVLGEMGWVVAIFGLLGLILLYKKDKRLFSYFLLWLILPYLVIAFLSKVIYPRYLIFLGTIIIILASYFLANIRKTSHLILSLLVLTIVFLYFDYSIVFQPKLLPFPEIDRGQYVEGATAAWGAKDIVDYAREKSLDKPVIILAEGNFGLIGDVLDVFTKKDDHIFIKGYWPLEEKQILENKKELAKNTVLVVFAQKKEFPQNWPLKLIQKFEKPGGRSTIYLFELR